MLKYEDKIGFFKSPFIREQSLSFLFSTTRLTNLSLQEKFYSLCFLMYTLIFTKEIFVFIKIISTFACISFSLRENLK